MLLLAISACEENQKLILHIKKNESVKYFV